MTPSPESFPDFDLKPGKPSFKFSHSWARMVRFFEQKLGSDSRVLVWFKELGNKTQKSFSSDPLNQLKQKNLSADQLNLILTLALVFVLLFAFRRGLPWLSEVDQLRNDVSEQAQVIKMEEQNMAFLEKIQQDRNTLQANLNKIYAALPRSDERAEEIISMLEDVGRQNNILIDSITIRKLPESQLNYDDLWGTVDVYEYAFSVESSLPHILSFIGSLRSSLRLMDIMSLEIEEGKDLYRGNFTLHAYHLVSDQ